MDRLEDLAKRAPTEPGVRGDFYKVFLDSFITIPHGNKPEELKIENGILQVGARLKLPSISADGCECIPVFSSPESMEKASQRQVPFIRLRGRDFLQIVRGSHVALNPSGWGKHFTPDEIETMLSGVIPGSESPRRIVTKEPEKILLGQPSKYPTRLVEALKGVFAQHSEVKAAYLAHCFAPSFGSSAHTTIGIDAERYDSIVVKIGPVVTSTIERNEIVDFISIRDGGPIADYMLKGTKPFYGCGRTPAMSPKAGFWRRLFGG